MDRNRIDPNAPCMLMRSPPLVNLRQAFRQQSPAAETCYAEAAGGLRHRWPRRSASAQIVEKIAASVRTRTSPSPMSSKCSSPCRSTRSLPAEIERGEGGAPRCRSLRRPMRRWQARECPHGIAPGAFGRRGDRRRGNRHDANAILLACSLKKEAWPRNQIGEAVDYVLRNASCEVVVIRRRKALSPAYGETRS